MGYRGVSVSNDGVRWSSNIATGMDSRPLRSEVPF
uniref:F5/8 type C domain-containing protein n=1 Tax=Anguilla anguilla TaxID=7936 RepID=A0A0E9QAA8_ANGAN